MPISSSAYTLEKKRILKCKRKSLTPNSQQTTQVNLLKGTKHVKQIQRSHSTLSITNSSQKNNKNEPLELKAYPDGTLHISRTEEEKEKNPDRMSLDRRGLSILPIIDDERTLRLLSLQHNLITSIDNLASQTFPILVFLDVYDNQIETINFLEQLSSLRVLLMGKNRIRKIEGLESLKNLEVLDLHGNQITSVSGLEQCQALKVLNLAGNQIKTIGVNDLEGLKNVQELNLRRNRVKRLLGFNETPNLQKLFLSNNELQSVEDIHGIAKAMHLKELTIDNNPVFQNGDGISFLISYLPKLTKLNAMIVNDQARKSAMAWRRNKEHSNDLFKDLAQNITFKGRREDVISNARTNWELLRTQTKYISTSNNIEKEHSGVIKPDSDFITTKLIKREKTLRNRTNINIKILPDKRKFMTRTNSLETDSSSNQSEQFRLPPILVPIVSKLEAGTGSTSSIGPNVDSSVSSILSSNSNLSHSEGVDGESTDEEAEFTKDKDIELEIKAEEIKPVAPPPPLINAENAETSSNLSSNTNTSSSVNASGSASDGTASTTKKRLRRAVKSAVNPSTKVATRVRAITAKPQTKKTQITDTTIGNSSLSMPREREQGGDYLIEICGRHLNVFGHGALRFIDKTWCHSKANDVHIVNFNYANFNGIYPILGKLKTRFPNADQFVFKETNIYCLGQLNALAEIQGLTALTIQNEGNPITDKEWHQFAIYRLAHWGLKTLNEQIITEEDIDNANMAYASLSDLVLWSLPNETLHPLLVRMRIDVNDEHLLLNCKQWLLEADPALRSVVSKEALQWKKTASSMQDDLIMRQKAKAHMGKLLHELCNTIKKVQLFETRWPTILHEIVRNTLIDYSHIDIYTRHQLLELMKNCNT